MLLGAKIGAVIIFLFKVPNSQFFPFFRTRPIVGVNLGPQQKTAIEGAVTIVSLLFSILH